MTEWEESDGDHGLGHLAGCEEASRLQVGQWNFCPPGVGSASASLSDCALLIFGIPLNVSLVSISNFNTVIHMLRLCLDR